MSTSSQSPPPGTRTELIEIVTRDPISAGGDEVWATDLVDAREAEVRAETQRTQRVELAAVVRSLIPRDTSDETDAAIAYALTLAADAVERGHR